MRYVFENFVLDVEKHELRRDGNLVAVEPQVFALLIHLIEQRERVVSKDELIEAIWEGRFVSDSVVSSRIKSARKALGDDGRTQQFIKTLHGTGFRFIASVKESLESNSTGDQQAVIEDITPIPRNDEVSPRPLPAESLEPGLGENTSWTDKLINPVPLSLLAVASIALFALTLWMVNDSSDNAERELTADNSVSSLSRSDGNITQNPTATSASIAVLPFDDFSQEGDQEYFADGISEELLNVLAQIEGLRVTSRTSAFAFKGREASVGEIAEALGVSHVLEGSVRKVGTTLRITAQLIDARSDQHVWSQTYDRALTAENLFAVQDEISQAIVAELQGRIDLPATNSALQTDSTEAYDAYLRGRSLIARRTADSVNDGIAELIRAASLDPDFAPAQSTLAEAYVLAFSYTGLSNEDAGALAAPHAERALVLAPEASEALAAKGRVLSVFEGNDAAAIVFFERAIAANPNFADAHRFLGLAQSSLLHIDDAKVSFETAQRLDPLAPVIFANLFRTNWDMGDLDAMLALGQENSRLNPDSIFSRRIMGGALRESGNYAAAHRLFKDNEALFGASRSQLAGLYYQIGRDDLAAPHADAYLKALFALRGGDNMVAAALVSGGNKLHEISILRWAGKTDTAYGLIKEDIARRNLLSGETQTAARDQTFDVYYTEILKAKNDPAAQTYRARLSARFDDHSPTDFILRDSFYAGAMWNMLNDDATTALEWLDALIDAGYVAPDIAIEPLFDSIRDTQGFKERLSRLEENAARHRAAIETQLASPDEGWIIP